MHVPSPGQNTKVAAFGALNYATGQHRALVPRVSKGGKNSAQFLLFVGGLLLRARRTGKRIVLALDNGPRPSQRSRPLLRDEIDYGTRVW